MQAACRAIESGRAQGYSAVEIRTDSKYHQWYTWHGTMQLSNSLALFAAATKWIKSWRKNGWMTTSGNPVKNRADIEHLSNLATRVDVKWVCTCLCVTNCC